MPTPAEQLCTVLRLINHRYVADTERPGWIRWLAHHLENSIQLAKAQARLTELTDERTAAAVRNWGERERAARHYHATPADRVSEPSRFNGRREHTSS